MIRASVLLVGMILISNLTFAAPRQPSGAELLRAVERLSVLGRVLYVAAHPDDENTRLLAWLANHKLVRAAYLSLTRGEGGQNLIGAEQGPLLGVIRTEELLAARAVDGAEQRFGLERDFGYSKSADETLRIWGKDDALGDVVWAIRRFRPDVIVTRFSPEARDTHGHHTASAMLALEAFRAAADPKMFPEQQLPPWQARRIVWNKGVWPGAPAEDLSGFVAMDVGGYDPVLGASFGEIASQSRSMHKSQGFGALPQRGPAPEYFRLLDGEPMKSSFLDGIDLSWKRQKGGEKIAAILQRARAAFRVEQPEAMVPLLVEALTALPDGEFKLEKRAELERLIAACVGLHAEANADESVAVPGGERKITVTAINRSPAQVALVEVRLVDGVVTARQALVANQPHKLEHALRIPQETPLANPFFLDEPPSPGRWMVRDRALSDLPARAPLSVDLIFEIAGQRITLTRPIMYAWLDPVAGERRRPLEILPPVTLEPGAPLLGFVDGKAKELRVTVTATSGPASGELRPGAPAGWTVEPAARPFSITKKGDSQALAFSVKPPAREGAAQLSFSAKVGSTTVSTGVVRIEHAHLPPMTLSPPAQVKLLRLEVKRGGARIAYIAGAGDEVPAALRQAGYEVTLLSEEALRGDLSRFDAVVSGVRAFNVNPKLFSFREKLMSYLNSGGTLVVQYNTQNRLSKIAGEIGPFPFEISQERVTDENAGVALEDHAVLRAPNKIEARDFEGWVQERGLYFAGKWDSKYAAPLAMNDSGEPPRKGALLVAQHGKGRFVYTGLAFFRQLPAGVPGAFRLFANLLAHGR